MYRLYIAKLLSITVDIVASLSSATPVKIPTLHAEFTPCGMRREDEQPIEPQHSTVRSKSSVRVESLSCPAHIHCFYTHL